MTDLISKDRFTELVKQLESAFSSRIPRARLEMLWDVLKGSSETHVRKGFAWLINNKPHLPINHDIITACAVEREKEWQQKKAEEQQQAREFFDPGRYGRGLGRDAIICINKLLDSDSREERVQLMLDMEKKYPNVGYKGEARILEKYYENLKDDELPF